MTAADIGSLTGRANTPTTQQVADVVAGIAAIGTACEALRTAGWQASIAGNRITVDDTVHAQRIGSDAAGATWVVFAIDDTRPVWVVGAERMP